MKRLIINADDFGLSPGVNDGIIRCHEHGVVTSASLMVRQPAAAEAGAYAQRRPALSVGLHVDLCEWAYTEGEWRMVYQFAPLDNASAVEAEVVHQLELFHRLTGRKPTHLDSHQHVHRDEPLQSILLREAARLGVPVRLFTPNVRYVGSFYGQSDRGEPFPEGVSVDALIRLIRALPEGVTEMGCHPGLGGDVENVYRAERTLECESLCDPRVKRALAEAGIGLLSFAGLPTA